jgi:hypothetical protein
MATPVFTGEQNGQAGLKLLVYPGVVAKGDRELAEFRSYSADLYDTWKGESGAKAAPPGKRSLIRAAIGQ